MKADVKQVQFDVKGDSRGQMVIVEGESDIPFPIARVFFMYGSNKDVIRGQHANRKTEFVLINVKGSSKVKVIDGEGERVFVLDKPYMGLYMPKMTWKEMYDFSEDSVLLCIASEPYDAQEYIRDYKTFLEELKKDA